MKILIATHYLGFKGGVDEQIDQMVKNLNSFGLPTRLIRDSNPIRLYRNTRKNIDWADIVNLHDFPSTLGSLPYCNKPVVWNCHDIPELYTRYWKTPFEYLHRQSLMAKNRYIVVGSKTAADRLYRVYSRTADYIVPYSLDGDFFSKGERTNSDTFRILHIGWIGKFRNQLETLDIYEQLLKTIPQATLTLAGPRMSVGSGPIYWDNVNRVILERGLSSKVKLTGQLTPEELRTYMFQSDVLIHPVTSLVGWMTLFEALASGLPVVTTNRFVGADKLSKFGLVTDNLLEGLLEVYRYREKYLDMATLGSEWVRKNLTWKAYSKRMLEVFQSVLKDEKSDRYWWMRGLRGEL